jgi:hypothetical protein
MLGVVEKQQSQLNDGKELGESPSLVQRIGTKK